MKEFFVTVEVAKELIKKNPECRTSMFIIDAVETFKKQYTDKYVLFSSADDSFVCKIANILTYDEKNVFNNFGIKYTMCSVKINTENGIHIGDTNLRHDDFILYTEGKIEGFFDETQLVVDEDINFTLEDTWDIYKISEISKEEYDKYLEGFIAMRKKHIITTAKSSNGNTFTTGDNVLYHNGRSFGTGEVKLLYELDGDAYAIININGCNTFLNTSQDIWDVIK